MRRSRGLGIVVVILAVPLTLVHLTVVLGQLHGDNDHGDKEQKSPTDTEPKRILEKNYNQDHGYEIRNKCKLQFVRVVLCTENRIDSLITVAFSRNGQMQSEREIHVNTARLTTLIVIWLNLTLVIQRHICHVDEKKKSNWMLINNIPVRPLCIYRTWL